MSQYRFHALFARFTAAISYIAPAVSTLLDAFPSISVMASVLQGCTLASAIF